MYFNSTAHSAFAARLFASSCSCLASLSARSSAGVIVIEEVDGPPPFKRGVRSEASLAFNDELVDPEGGRD